MIPNQEEKFEAVYKSLTEKATEQLLFNTFLKMYPEAWKQLKITFSKFKKSNPNKTPKIIPIIICQCNANFFIFLFSIF